MTFFSELKRRNVVRVGIAYAVGAWLVLQLTEVLSELLKFPDSVGPIVVSLVAVGFPIVLIIAWVFELTPDGLKRETEIEQGESITTSTGKKLNVTIFALTAIALAYFIWESRFSDRQPLPAVTEEQQVSQALSEQQAMTAEAPATDVNEQSIAVLPFENRSNLEGDQFFVDGVHDDLLTSLARIGSLKVISRTSVRAYSNTDKTIPVIAGELGVTTIMEGAVQRSGNTVRINVQLIDAQTDEHLWAEIFDREMTADNLFTIQSEISEKIAAALQTTLTEAEQDHFNRKPTDNLAAYNAYLKGRQLAVQRNADDLEEALVLFEEAVSLDPDFAEAWSGYALATFWAANYGNLNPSEAMPISFERAEKALQLNPNLGEPWLIRAAFRENDNDVAGAEEAYLRALELSPNNALAHHWYANFLDNSSARLDEAFFHAMRATQLDPLSSIDQLELADLYQKLGKFEDAEKHIRQVMNRDPEFSTSYQYMGYLKEETGRFDEWLLMSRKSQALNPQNFRLMVDEAMAVLGMDDVERLPSVRERIEAESLNPIFPSMFSVLVAMHAGRAPAALETLKGIENTHGGLPFLPWFQGWAHLLNSSFSEARIAFEKDEPRLWSPDSWQEAYQESISLACIAAALMTRTGDENLGRELNAQVLAYFENELPNYIDYPERYDASICYLESGQKDAAIALTENRLTHGFLTNWWFIRHNPLQQPLLTEPRVLQTLEVVNANLEKQQQQVRQWEAEGAL